MTDEFYMNLAIKKAWEYQFLTYKNPAVGCVLLDKNDKILSISAHQKYGQAHAELNAILDALKVSFDNANQGYDYALKNHNNLFLDGSIYVTLSPCTHHGKTPPCAELIKKLGFKKVVYALSDDKLERKSDEVLQGMIIKSGVLKDKAYELTKPFLNGGAIIFKLATSLNGAYDGKITNKEVDFYTHQIRQNIDLLIIGGDTARYDKPLLDTRHISGDKNPDIFVHTRNFDALDKSLPFFKIKNRIVSGGDTLPELKNKLVLIEGGEKFLNIHKDKIDYLMIIQNHTIKQGKLIKDTNLNLNLIYQKTIQNNTINIFEIIKF